MAARKNKPLSFEEGIGQIEKITEALSSGTLTLEESMKAYEKGMQLAQSLQAEMESYRKRIAQIDPVTGEIAAFEEKTYDV